MQDTQLSQISNFIWGVADDLLRDVYVRGKYRDVILPMTVLRRLDAVLEPTKQKVLDEKKWLDDAGIGTEEQAAVLEQAAGQAFYNTSPFNLRDLTSRAARQQLRDDFNAYLDGFSHNVQDILEKFEFRNQLNRLSDGDILGDVVARFLSPQVNLSPEPVLNSDGSIRLPGLDNHAIGTIFEDLVRRFNEENNEEAGEHWTPRDAVELMAQLVFQPIREKIASGTYLLYDGAIGTGGMLTIAEQTLRGIADENDKQVSTHLYGQEVNNETFAICKADMLLKGERNVDENVIGGPQHSTLSNDAFQSKTFDFMLSNPPYGKSWGNDLEKMGGKKGLKDPRFLISHAGNAEYSLVTRTSDGQMLFLANMASKMKHDSPWAAGSPRSITGVPSSPATPARGRATSGAGSSRTTGWRPSWPCPSTCSTTRASPPTSGCCPTGSRTTARARSSSSTPRSGSHPSGRTWARRTASYPRRTSIRS